MRASRILPFIDRWLGIPLVFGLGCLRLRKSNRSLPEHPKIALLNTAAIGDTILISGVIDDLKERYPSSEITFFVGASNYEAAMLIEGIKVVRIEVQNPWRSIQVIRSESFDLWIDFGQWPRINALYSYFAKAKFKIGFQTYGQYRHYVYDATAHHEKIHELDNFRKLIAILGIRGHHLPQIKKFSLSSKGNVKLALHCFAGGSGAALKQWPEKNWISLIDSLAQKGYRFVLTGGKGDRVRCEKIKEACLNRDCIEVAAGSLSLCETAKLLADSYCTISVDTGIMHLAAALGCRTLALHGPTSPNRWGGIGPRVVPITPSGAYRPFIHLGFEKGPLSFCSMDSISVEQVLHAFEKIL